jgi:hypothetical protein
MAIGKNSKLQLSIEDVYGVAKIPDVAIKHTSEGLKLSIDSKSEETLIGGKVSTGVDIMGFSVAGDVSAYARPGTLGYLLGLALGCEAAAALEEGSTGAYKHSFTLIGSSAADVLPSASITIDRKIAVKTYTGCKCDTFGIEISQGDYIKLTQGFKGNAEEPGTIQALTTPERKAFRFINGSVKVNGSAVAYITGAKIDIANNLDDGGKTLGSGLYNSEYEHQDREVKISLDVNYVDGVETLREDYFKTGETISIDILFESSEEVEDGIPYNFSIAAPLVMITDLSPTVSSGDKLTTTIEGLCIESDTDEPITISVIDEKETEYLS